MASTRTGDRRSCSGVGQARRAVDWLPDGAGCSRSPAARACCAASRTDGGHARRPDGARAAPGTSWSSTAGQRLRQQHGFDFPGDEPPRQRASRVVTPDGAAAGRRRTSAFPNGMGSPPTAAPAPRRVPRPPPDRVRHRRPTAALAGRRVWARPRGRSSPTASASTPRGPSGSPTPRSGAAAGARGREEIDGRSPPSRLLRLHARRRGPAHPVRPRGRVGRARCVGRADRTGARRPGPAPHAGRP